MSLFALITALLLEQLHPLTPSKRMLGWMADYANFFRHNFNAGQPNSGKLAWLLAILPLLLVATLVYLLLFELHPVFAWAFNTLVLYLTMGFRQFSHYFTNIHQALRDDRLDEARRLLSIWRGVHSHELNSEEVARLTIEQALIASHRNVFGVIVWFVIFGAIGMGGAAGALLYRLTQFLRANWAVADGIELTSGVTGAVDKSGFGKFSSDAFHVLDWLPVRLTAITFAIVGNFEDTIYCWRTQAASWPETEAGILLSSGAGALGVRLGMPIPQGGLPLDRPELGVGDEADVDFMQSTIGLVWRSIVFCLMLLLLLSLANLLG